MKVILAMVLSLDGRSTKGEIFPQFWASREDQKHLSKIIKEFPVIVIGGRAFSEMDQDVKPVPGKLKIVSTRNPQKFSRYEVPSQLEFTSETPKELVNRLSELGYKQMLLLTGQTLNSMFLEENLVDEFWLTLEPRIFGEGNGIATGKYEVKLKLKSSEKLNKSGTLLLKYDVS